MIILSFHSGGHDASAVLFNNHQLISAIQLERLTREKGDGNRIPVEAIAEVLKIAGLKASDVDVVMSSRMGFPAQYYTHWPLVKNLEYRLRGLLGAERIKHLSGELQRTGHSNGNAIFDARRFLVDHGFKNTARLVFYNHHYAHALSALAYTDWQDALLYTADAGGDNVHWSHHIVKDNTIQHLFGTEEELHAKQRVDSLGLAYGYTTQALGYKMARHEGKLTGLAAYGEPTLAESIGNHFSVDDLGRIDSDFSSHAEMRSYIFNLTKEEKPENSAASIQEVLESKIQESVGKIISRYGCRNLGLAGGVFANVRLNRLLAESLDIDEIFIFPGMGDEGIPVGGVHQFLIENEGFPAWLNHRHRLQDVYLGCDYTDRIDAVLETTENICNLSDKPASVSSQLLAKGWVGAIYSGRMEFGPRALGARSILASPVDTRVNDTLNERLQRTEFMPFAPFVLEEDATKVFDISAKNRYAARFMTITCDVLPEWRERIPAVVHVDGTARPQIIRRKDNPLYADILKEFNLLTGLPVLVNTSFNAHEEPIINTPEECATALLNDRVDFVVTTKGVFSRDDRAQQINDSLNES